MGVDPLERLAGLYAYLRDSRRPRTRTEIMDNVAGYGTDSASSRRGFERDKDALRGMGVQISVVRLDPTSPTSDLGYLIPESSLLPDPGLTEDEERALALAVATIRMGDDENAQNALFKMGGGRGPAEASATVAVVKTDPRVPSIQDAIARRCVLRFSYRGMVRTIEPRGLTRANKGRWYLTGFDRLRQAERRFRLDQVEGGFEVASEPGAFEAVAPTSALLPAWMYGGEFTDVALLVQAQAAEWAIREAGANVTVERHEDGSATLTIPVANTEAFRGFALSLLDSAVIVAPASHREDLVDWVRSFVERASA